MLYLELARRNKKWSQGQLAKLARVDQAFVSMIERGQALPTPDQADRFAAALEIASEILTNEVPVTAEVFDEVTP